MGLFRFGSVELGGLKPFSGWSKGLAWAGFARGIKGLMITRCLVVGHLEPLEVKNLTLSARAVYWSNRLDCTHRPLSSSFSWFFLWNPIR